ncbi:MAG: tRNA preQ1(34) S-adenosylmethionine ribosyltransferase-isomerase QueA, partial [Roseimicrobium sp.]
MLTSEFDYHLPEELIATAPLADRAASRMLVVDRAQQSITHRSFRDLPEYIRAGDILVLNDSRVVPARYFSNDGTKELLRLEVLSPTEWRCMVKPGRKLRLGHRVEIGEAIGTVVQVHDASGDRVILFDRVVDEARHGHLALPPYMHREEEVADRQRYQTVYARESGSIAAPTAGLHFTPELLQTLPHAFVTLHVGVGTFQPVKVDRVADHLMHTERYSLREAEAKKIQASRRVLAVGTTAARVLESVFRKHNGLVADCGETNIFIYPPYNFSVVGALLTNFHLP